MSDAEVGHGGEGGGAAEVPPEIAAEAAVWVARLHGPGRSWRMERECLDWQAGSEAHRLAFERCTDTWQEVAGLTLSTYANSVPWGALDRDVRKPVGANRRRWAMAAAAVGVAGVLVLQLQPQLWWMGETYATAVGEQRLVILGDGSRMSLNTATRVNVSLSADRRSMQVEEGEAFFEVAKDAGRPFVVQAAGTEVVATGTAFVVQLGARQGGSVAASLAVTLVEGEVQVREVPGDGGRSPQNASVTMSAGERMRWRPAGQGAGTSDPQLDRPRMDQVLAWKRGEVIFDDLSLPEALAEMNRYSGKQVRVAAAPDLGRLRVSGVFRTGDPAAFVRALVELHGLQVREHGGVVELILR